MKNDPMFCEGMFTLDEAAKVLEEQLPTPIDLVHVSVSRDRGNPLVHLIVDALGVTPSLVKAYRMTPVERPYAKPGFTPVAATALHLKTGTQVVVTDRTARDNPNLSEFEGIFLDATYSDDDDAPEECVRADPHENTVNLFIAPTNGRVAYVRSAHHRRELTLPFEGPARFLITQDAIVCAEHEGRMLFGITLQEVSDFLSDVSMGALRETELARMWRPVGELPFRLLSFSRASPVGGVVVTMIPDYPGISVGRHPVQHRGFQVRADGGEIHLVEDYGVRPVELDQSETGMILGPTTAGSETDEIRLAVTRHEPGERIESVAFLPYQGLSEELRRLVERVLPVPGAG